jgi:hypothetical protein
LAFGSCRSNANMLYSILYIKDDINDDIIYIHYINDDITDDIKEFIVIK